MIVALLLAWLPASLAVALLVGRGIRLAGNGTTEPDLLADQPVEVLAPAEIRRRIAAYEREMAA